MKIRSYVEKFFFAILCLFLIAGSAMAQQVISGIVVDARSLNPLKGADVYLKLAKVGTTTDDDGFFRLEVAENALSDTLMVSFLGFETYVSRLSTFPNRSRIELQPGNLSVSDSVTVRDFRSDISRQEIPHARSEISFEEIESRGSSEIGDIFKNIPAVRIEGNDLNGRRIQIRGSDASEVNVYIDGVLINNLGVSDAADLSIIPVESIESLEVLKGSNMTLLGNGAFGGVVNIHTRKKLDREVYLKTKQGSFNSQYYIGEVNVPLSRNFVLNYFGQVNSNKPGIEFFPGEVLDSTKTENAQVDIFKQNHNLRMDYYLSEGQLSARVFGYVLDYQKPSWQNLRQNLIVAGSYRGTLLGAEDLDLMLNYQIGKDDIERLQTQVQNTYEDIYQTRRLNFRAAKKYTADKNEFQLLAEYYHDEVDIEFRDARRANPLYYGALLYENRFSFAGVAGFSNQFNNRPDITWKTHFGLRDDYITTGEHFVSPTIGIQIEYEKPNYVLTPYLSYGKNVRFHSLADNAYLQLQEIDAGDSTLNRLEPEVNNAGEMGFSLKRDVQGRMYSGYEVAMSVFRSTIVNKLIQLPSDPSRVLSQIGRNETNGFETSLKFNGLLKRMSLQATATMLDISDLSLYPFKPENMFSVQLDYQSPWGFYVNTTLFREGKSSGLVPAGNQTNELISEEIPAFYDVDIAAGYRFRVSGMQWHLQASGYNILDNSGYQFYLLKKQYFQVSLSVKL